MREIKFRLWAKDELVMVYPPKNPTEIDKLRESGLFLSLGGQVYSHCRYDTGGCGDDWSKRYDVMQYTGLKDKNGVEIYEGDILGWYGHKYGSDEKIFTGTFIVQWCDNSAGFSLYSIGENRLKMRNGMFPIDIDSLYVGGNAHQNPEFLTNKTT